MVWSVIVGDEVQDIRFTKHAAKGYFVWLGDRRLGMVFSPTKCKNGWRVLTFGVVSNSLVSGFISRERAVNFMLHTLGYYCNEYAYELEHRVFKLNMDNSLTL